MDRHSETPLACGSFRQETQILQKKGTFPVRLSYQNSKFGFFIMQQALFASVEAVGITLTDYVKCMASLQEVVWSL